jgi:hypothetical protein
MRAVTGYRRLPILAIAATLLAGCGASSTAAPLASPAAVISPGAGPSDGPSPAPTVTDTPAPVVTPEPSSIPSPSAPSGSSLCPPALPPAEPVVGLWDSSGLVSTHLEIRRVAFLTDPEAELPVPGPVAVPGAVRFVGGGDVTFDLSWYESTWHHLTTFTRFRATLEMDGREPLDLPVRFESRNGGKSNVAIATVPDVEGSGRIDLRVEFRDPCFIVAGRVASPVHVYSAVSVAACPRDTDAGFDELGETFRPPIHVGGREVDLLPFHFTGKVAGLWVIDSPPPYVGFRRDTPTLAVTPGTALDVTSTNESVELLPAAGYEVTFYRRAPLLRWVENGWIHGDEPDAEIVFRSALIGLPDGTFAFEAPAEPGRYAAEVVFDYDSSCTIGRAGFVVGIDVVAP